MILRVTKPSDAQVRATHDEHIDHSVECPHILMWHRSDDVADLLDPQGTDRSIKAS